MLAAQLMALLVAAVAAAAGNDEGLSLSRERETERTQQELTEQLLADQAERQPELRDPMSIGYYPSRRERPPSGSGPTSSPLPSTPGGGVSSSSSTAQLPSSSQATSSPSVQPVSSPQAPVVTETEEASLRLPGAGSTKPTKYHYYPHNQHIYLLPECAVQQVCNAVYVRLNYTQPLCACPSRYREPCSASLNSDDLHTTELSTQPSGKVLTLVKTCEPVADMRVCRSPRDWSLLALQNIRTGKSHYLVICRCPETSILEGPMSHDQPTYASVPGIRVYGMMCVSKGYRSGPSPTPTQGSKRRSRPLRSSRDLRFWDAVVPFPWHKVKTLIKSMDF